MSPAAYQAAIDAFEGLAFLWLEITGRCNLTCSHCYAESGPSATLRGAMSTRDWTGVLDEAADLGCQQIQFIGGEPTLHPDLELMLSHAHVKGFTFIEVFTNLTRLSNRLIECFQRHDVQVASSFYSDNFEVHDRITCHPGSWRRTVSGLKTILGAGIPLRVGIIEMEENAGEAWRSRKFLQSMGVNTISSDRMRGVGRGNRATQNIKTERFEELCGKCGHGKLCVSPSGAAFPCVFSRATSVGNAKHGLTSILKNVKLREFRERMLGARGRQVDMEFSDCNPDCMPYCNPNCNPDCTPHCNPNCSPDCMPHCNPNCNPDRRW